MRIESRPVELPTLNHGIRVLETDSRTSGALQSLVLDHLLTRETPGEAIWVDSHGNGSTQPLAQLAPSRRVLERIAIARGFTAFQHYSLLKDLATQVTDETALVVLPELDWFYRHDALHHGEAERMVSAGISLVEDLHRRSDVPVLMTQTVDDEFSQPVRSAADEVIQCKQTRQGPRFVGEDFETLVYPGNGYVQTTIAYWNRILSARHPEAGQLTVQPEVAAVGAN
jgi:hypothetical protein